ncbi:MAG: hypothetical protein O7H40_04465 [Gammaproteobacteria bacterium]|nr:hypothetical protein [Gammaproteobacteria bacterium]
MAKVAPLLASLLSLPLDRYPPLNLSPRRQKDDTIAALAAQVTGLAGRQPLLMLFEDAHWCDPTTLEVLSAVIGRIEAAPVLLVFTYRPEFDPPWTGHGHVVVQSLSRLGKRQGVEMVERVTSGKTLPDEVLDQIVAKTDGVPLFVEELTKTVLEAGFLKDAGDHFELDGPLPPLAIPSTLQDSLMARLDRLSPVKEVAQIGACIGREFSYEVLAAISPLRDNELADALQQLVNSELIFRRGTPPHSTYTFKHALVQVSAHESLLKSKRQSLHGSIARILEARSSDRTVVRPELIAHHFKEASLDLDAIPHLINAGRWSLEKMALAEALDHLSEALELVGRQASSEARDNHELDVRVALAMAHLLSKGWAAHDTFQVLEPARALCSRPREQALVISTYFYLWIYFFVRCEFEDMFQLLDEMLTLAEADSEDGLRVVAYMCASLGHGVTGDFVTADQFAKRFLGAYDVERHAQIARFLLHDPKCFFYSWATYFYWILGRIEDARRAYDEQIDIARGLDNILNLIWTLTGGSDVLAFMGQNQRFLANIEEARQIAHEQAMEFFEVGTCAFHRPFGLIGIGEYQLVDEQMAYAVDRWSSTGGVIQIPQCLTFRAQALAHMDRPDDALAAIEQATCLTEQNGDRHWEAETHRIHGEILLMHSRGSESEIESCFQTALTVARKQQAKSWELRAATSLARLWQSQGKTQEAHDLLAPVYDWFTEGFDTADLAEARALLDELH